MTRSPLLTLLLFSTVGIARAEEAKVQVTTFSLSHEGVEDRTMVAVMRTVAESLRHNSRVEMKDLDARIADYAQEVPQAQIDEGRALLAAGEKALQTHDLKTAQAKLTQAVDSLSRVLPFIKKQELADSMMALGACQAEMGDVKGSKATFLRLLTWRSDYHFDPARFAASLAGPVEDARHDVEKARRGSLEIDSTPSAAQAYVDGKYVGVTPAFAEGLPAGEHWVTLKREGYRKAVKSAKVSGKEQAVVSFNLERSGKSLIVEQAIAALDKSIGKNDGDLTKMDDLKNVLYIDHAVFVRTAPATPGSITVDAYLFDLRNRRQLSHINKNVLIAQVEKQVGQIPSMLYVNVNYEAELEAPKEAPPPKANVRPPFYKTWWFWTVTGVVTAGVIVTAVLARPAPSCDTAHESCLFFR